MKYKDSYVTLYLGDCVDIMKGMEPESIDAVFTDPPYLVDYQSHHRKEMLDKIENDTNPKIIEEAFTEIFRVLKKDSLCLSFYGWPNVESFIIPWKQIGFKPISHIVFVKNVWGFGQFTRTGHECAYLLAKGKPKLPDVVPSSVQEMERILDSKHPTPKGWKTVQPLIEAYTEVGDVILDPFVGGGSFLRAAKNLHRKGIGIDTKEEYLDEAIALLRQDPLPIQVEKEPEVQGGFDIVY